MIQTEIAAIILQFPTEQQLGGIKVRIVLRFLGHVCILTIINSMAYVNITFPKRIYKPRCMYIV